MSPSHFPLPRRKRAVMFLPVMPSLAARWTCASALPNHTRKKRAAKFLARMLVPLLGSRTLMSPWLVSLPPRAQALLTHLEVDCILPEMEGTVVNLSPVTGRKRIYLQHLDASGRVLAYSKIGFGPEDSANLAREAKALTLFAGNTDFIVPDPLTSGDSPEIGAYLVTAALDPGFSGTPVRSNHVFERVAATLAGPTRSRSRKELAETWWFRRATARLDSRLKGYVARLLARPMPLSVCCAHGDIGGENLYSSADGRIALIDWESFDACAPVLTDPVSHWIGVHHAALRTTDNAETRSLFGRFADRHDDLAFALLFLVGTDIAEARMLLSALFDFDRASV